MGKLFSLKGRGTGLILAAIAGIRPVPRPLSEKSLPIQASAQCVRRPCQIAV